MLQPSSEHAQQNKLLLKYKSWCLLSKLNLRLFKLSGLAKVLAFYHILIKKLLRETLIELGDDHIGCASSDKGKNKTDEGRLASGINQVDKLISFRLY